MLHTEVKPEWPASFDDGMITWTVQGSRQEQPSCDCGQRKAVSTQLHPCRGSPFMTFLLTKARSQLSNLRRAYYLRRLPPELRRSPPCRRWYTSTTVTPPSLLSSSSIVLFHKTTCVFSFQLPPPFSILLPPLVCSSIQLGLALPQRVSDSSSPSSTKLMLVAHPTLTWQKGSSGPDQFLIIFNLVPSSPRSYFLHLTQHLAGGYHCVQHRLPSGQARHLHAHQLLPRADGEEKASASA